MMRAENDEFGMLERMIGGRFPARRILSRALIGMFVLLGIVMFLIIANHAQADTYKVSVTWNNPSDGTADVTPGQWTTYTVDIENTGENFGEDINLTAEFDDPNKVTEGWSVSPALLQFELEGNEIVTKAIKIRPPSNASYEDDATVYVKAEVVGHEGDQGGTSGVTLYANVLQVYGVTNSVKEGDNIHNVSVDIAASTIFYLNITNKGNGEDSYDLTYSGVPSGWPNPSFSTDTITDLPSGETASVSLTVNVPANTQSTSYTLITEATSQGNPSKSSTASVTVQVLPRYRCSIETSPERSDGDPGETMDYQITIKNTGNIAEDFTITHTVIEGETWSKGISISPKQNLDYKQNKTFTFSVTIGSGATEDMFNRVEVKVSSDLDTTKNSSVIIRTDVNQVYGVSVFSPVQKSADPGETIWYLVDIKNTGNGVDTINIETSGAFDGGLSNASSLSDMQPDEVRTINVTVNVHEDSPAGIQEITVTGISDKSIDDPPTVSDYGTIQIDVNERYEITLYAIPTSLTGTPGGDPVVFQVRIDNDGTGTDDVLLSLVKEKSWPASLSTNFINELAPGGHAIVYVNITVPSGEEVNQWYFNVTGESIGDPTAKSTVALRVDVEQVYNLILSSSDSSNSIPAGTQTSYQIKVKNTGSGYDEFTVRVWVGDPILESWCQWTPESFGLNPGANKTVTLTVDVPLGTVPGSYEIRLNVTSDGSVTEGNPVRKYWPTTTTVTHTYSVLIAGSTEQNGESPPDSEISYVIEVRNKGTNVDDFKVEIAPKPISKRPSWTNVIISPNYIAGMQPNVLYLVYVNITILEDTEGETEDYLKIIITSQEDPNLPKASAYVWINTTITPERDAKLTPQPDTFDREPGDTIVVTIQLTNEGTATDTLTLEDVTPEPYDTWGIVQLPATVTLGPSNSTNMTYIINIDPDVTREESPIKLNLVVKSTGADDEIVETKNITIKINQTFGVRISTTQKIKTGDPGEEVIFLIKVKNEGNDVDTVLLSDEGDELGQWSETDVELGPDEFANVYYNITIDPEHNTTDIIIKLNATSQGGEDAGMTIYHTLVLTIHVDPRYEVELNYNGRKSAEVHGGESVVFNLTVKNKGTAQDICDITLPDISDFEVTASTLVVTLEPEEIVEVKITVKPDEGTAIGNYDIIINVTSQKDDSATAEYTFIARVQASYDLFLSTSTTNQKVAAGETATFTGVKVENKGNDEDIFTFFVTLLPPAWSHSPLPDVPVSAGDFNTFNLDITTDSASASGLYGINLTARSVNDPTKEKTITLIVEVEQIYGVQLPDSVSGKNVDPGEMVVYIIKVKNTGNGDDNFELRLTGDVDPDETWLYFDPTENGTTIHVSPPSGGSLDVYLYISPDADYWDLGGDSEITLTIEAESLEDPDAINPESDSVQVRTTVNPVYGVEIQPSQVYTSGDPGETISFLFGVKNTGTVTDTFNIRVDVVETDTGGDTSKWYPGIRFNPTSVDDLAKGGTRQVTMTIDIPSPSDLSLIPPGIYNITIEITSSSDTDVKDTQIFDVDVQQLYWADIQNIVSDEDVNVGETVQYTITIKNKGNDIDMLSVRIEGDPDIPGSANWGKLTHAGTGQFNKQSLVDIELGAGISTDIILNITIPERTDSTYPTIDPDDVTLIIKVEPSDEEGTKDEVEVTADINTIYEFKFTFLADTKEVLPGDPAVFTMKIENKGTAQETFTYEIFKWEKDWSTYGYTFDPSSIQIPAGTIMDVELSVNTPSDLAEAVSKDYNVTIKVHSAAGDDDYFENCTIHIDPVYGVKLNLIGSASIATDVGNNVTYKFTVENTGNDRDTFSFTISDLDPSAEGGGDQSSWASLALVSDPSTKITSVTLDQGDSESIVLTIRVPPASPNFPELKTAVEIKVEANSEDPDTDPDDIVTKTTVNPIYSFVLSTTAPLDTKEGQPDDVVSFTLQVKNTGTTTDSYGFRISSVDETIFTVASINDVTGVEVNELDSTMVSIEITDDKKKAIAGTYQIEIAADSKGEASVSEVITLNIEITAAAGVDVSADVTSDNEEPGESVDYTIKIHNTGNAEDTFRLTLEDEAKDWGDILDINDLTPIREITLGADSANEVILRVTIPATGETLAGEHYSIILKATSTSEDISDEVKVTTTVDEYVELYLEYSGIGTPTKNYDPNDKLPKFSFRVVNNGNKDEDGIQIEIDGIGDDWEYQVGGQPGGVLPESLGPGKSTTFTLEFTDIPEDEKVGDYALQVYARSSIDDKVKSDPVPTTINITKPDLSISSSDVTGLDDESYLKGRVDDTVTITAKIYNLGSTEAKDAQVKLYEEVGGSTTVRDTETISSLAAGASRDIDFKWKVLADEVDIRIEISGIFEITEGNNKISRIYLDLRPDLDFVGEKLNFSKSQPEPGETITITAFILNSGGDAEDVKVKFYEGQKLIGQDTLDIDYDETGEATVEWKVPDDPGDTIDIRAEIDLSGAIGDNKDHKKSIKIASAGVGEIFSGSGMISMGIGLGIGAILFLIIGLVVGRAAGRKAGAGRAPEGMAGGPSFAALEKEMAEGAAKKAPKGPAPFERMEGEEAPEEEEEAPEEEKAKPRELVRVRCPKCGRVKEVTSTQRPLQLPCECGTTLMLKK